MRPLSGGYASTEIGQLGGLPFNVSPSNASPAIREVADAPGNQGWISGNFIELAE